MSPESFQNGWYFHFNPSTLGKSVAYPPETPYRRTAMTDLTFYDLLQVAPDASDDAIRHAYRAAAKRHHPDTNPLDRNLAATRFRLIQEAYDMLRDPVRRKAYDTELRARLWYGSFGRNDNAGVEATDVFSMARRNLERLMRLMARERDVPVSNDARRDE